MASRHFCANIVRIGLHQPQFASKLQQRPKSTPLHHQLSILRVRPWNSRRTLVTMQVGPNPPGPPNEADGPESPSAPAQKESQGFEWNSTMFKMAEAALTTFASVAILGLVGYSYTKYYKHMVLEKMENAFEPGDPALDLVATSKRGSAKGAVADTKTEDHHEHWVLREEQELIDSIVSGQLQGQYHLLIGEKGSGKSSMLLDAMLKIEGEGCALLDAHADPEIFRIRLGKALDFEFHEDNIGSLFSIRGPRDANALLDVERAFNKLEKVALKRRARLDRPLILIFNSMHLIRDDEAGRDLLELLQQRAELWAASNLATVIFNSDDYWIYERLKQYATRMNVIPILDLTKPKAVSALASYRHKYRGEEPDLKLLEAIYEKVGGRLSFLGRIAKADDMLQMADDICYMEKQWFLNKCWILGEEMDDDVMDQQKYASAAMVLAKALVDMEKDMETTYDPEKGHILPQMPLHKARQVMTRADFIQSYDAINIFTIDSHAMVRADSVPMMNAFREICAEEGFDEFLEATLTRISDIESLGRTRELTIKDLWDGGKYNVKTFDPKGRETGSLLFEVAEKEDKDG